jgi:sialate O-acetylesterase
MKTDSVCLLVTLSTAILAPAARGEVRLHPLFSDHAVLQAGMKAPVWGRAAPGERVTVEFQGQRRTAAADPAGRWQVVLDDLKAIAEPAELRVVPAAGEPIVVKDVLVGEVWLASGQSNMEWPVEKSLNPETEVAAAQFPGLRQFLVNKTVAFTPQDWVEGTWVVCSPETVGKFSAVAYFFGRHLHNLRKTPVGLVHCSAGWTPAEAWMSRAALQSDPDFAYILERWDAATEAAARYDAALKAWKAEAEKAKAAGQPEPAQPAKPRVDPSFIHRASGFWNGGIAPLAPFAIRGVIWYQGETNEVRGYEYRKLFQALIRGWREAWAQPDLPFLFVQVANVLPPDPQPVASEWAELRESQRLALALPRTGMAVAIDVGEEKDVHPKNKQEIGRRLALIARAQVYGEKDLVFSGPLYRAMKVEGAAIRCEFDYAAGGLATPGNAPLRGFAIAGADRKFVYADARLEGETVVVSSPQVPEPVAVRYAWANNPAGCNLQNQAGLPASPFRTDDWPAKTAGFRKLYIDP